MNELIELARMIAFASLLWGCSAALTGCGVSYGDFRAGTTGYIEELTKLETVTGYDRAGRVRVEPVNDSRGSW